MTAHLSSTVFTFPHPPSGTGSPITWEPAPRPVPHPALPGLRPSPHPTHVSASPTRTTATPAGGPKPVLKGGPNQDTAPVSLVVIDDNRLLREGLAALIRSQPGFKVLAVAADITEALEKVRAHRPDVVLLDLGLESHDTVSLTATIHSEVPTARLIIMGLLPLQEDVADYVRAGASGFVMKDATFDEFFATIQAVAGGAEILPAALTNSLFSQIVRYSASASPAHKLEGVRLTARERQVIDLLGEGMSNKEIATHLHIAVHTVKSHVHNVLEKLALHSRLEVVAFTHARRGPKPLRP